MTKRFILLILIMTAVAVGIGVAAIAILYDAAINEERSRLVETAQSQARLMEAVARFDEAYSLNYPEGSKAATIAQIKDAHERYLGFGETGEFTLARRVGDDIVFVLRHRHLDMDKPQPVPFDSNYAEPMRRALSGQSGTTIGLDYRGVTVLAAHEPVSVLDLGIVAKIDLVEIRAPFLKAAAIVAVIATALIALGTMLFFRVGNPIIRRIQASEEKFRQILESAADAILIIDERGCILIANSQTAQLFGYARHELIGQPVELFLPEALREKHVAHRRDFNIHPRPRPMGQDLQLLGQRKDGTLVPLEISLSPVYQDEELMVTAIIRDITVRKGIEKALQDSEEKYRLAMEATQDGLWDWNVATGSVYYSPGWGRILGEKDIRNDYSTWENRIHPEDKPRILKSLRTHLDGETTAWQEEHRLRNVDGAWIWVLGRGRVVKHDRHGNPLRMVGTMSDINARKQAENTLAKAKETAELANKSKSRFLTAASHDLRQPVQAIASYTDLLAISKTDPALASTIQQLRNATLALQVLLEGLLDISKLDTGTMRPEIRTFSISSLLSQIQELHQPIAMEKGITLKLVPCTAVVNSDPILLRVILQNLISNAIKYTHRGKVILGCRHRGDQLRIEVWDSGIGIPEDKQKSVFEEFYQIDNPGRDRNKGVGIGLTIVKRIATLLNHELYMHSVAGKGSSFAIQVPLVDNAREDTHAEQPEITKFDDDSTVSSILLIEDDEIVLHANYGLLEALGYIVIPASDAEAAMQRMESETLPPDIIIADYRLPGGCVGTELVQQLRTKAGSQIPVIILTGDITLPDENSYLPDNSLLIQKPARAEELVQAINQLLGNPVASAE